MINYRDMLYHTRACTGLEDLTTRFLMGPGEDHSLIACEVTRMNLTFGNTAKNMYRL